MSETHILLVRHPETEANVSGRYVGRGESAFSQEGLRQLQRTPRKVARFAPEVVWTSPLGRALRLARRCSTAAGCPLNIDPALLELDFGIAEGMTFDEIAEAGIEFNFQDHGHPVAPGGESRRQIARRSADFCDALLAQGGRHAVVTHGGVFRASLVHLLGLSSPDIWAFHIHNVQLAHVRVIDGHGLLEDYRQG